MLTRLWVLVAMVAFRMWPLTATALYARAHPVGSAAWGIVLALTIGLQVVLQLVAARCSSEQLGYVRGLFIVGAAMSTGWSYLDLLLVPLVVLLVQAIALGLALLPAAQQRYLQLVALLVRHRMQQ